MALRQQIVSLLKERDEHPGLQKILDIIEMLLALPPSTSVPQVTFHLLARFLLPVLESS